QLARRGDDLPFLAIELEAPGLPSTEEREQLGAVVAPEQTLHLQANVGVGEPRGLGHSNNRFHAVMRIVTREASLASASMRSASSRRPFAAAFASAKSFDASSTTCSPTEGFGGGLPAGTRSRSSARRVSSLSPSASILFTSSAMSNAARSWSSS